MNYRVEAFFDDATVKLKNIKLTVVLDKNSYKKFEKLTEEGKAKFLKDHGWLQYRHMDVEHFGNSGGMWVEAEDEEDE